ncbi:SMR family transporter [Falsirhodobacter sp. 1013]
MKKSAGFTQITPTGVTIVTMMTSFGLLSVAMKILPLGTIYTI